MDDFQAQVIALVNQYGRKWATFEELLDEDREKIRSAYRRWAGTHTPDQIPRELKEEESDVGEEANYDQQPVVRLAFPTDEHFPYQDDRARELAMLIVEEFDPHILVRGSDGLDFYSISGFDKNPERVKNGGLQQEINMWKRGEREWRSVSDADRYWIPGNHEDRWRRYLWRHPEIAELDAMRVERLLDFGELGLMRARNGEIVIKDKLLVKHGNRVSRHSGYAGKNELMSEFYAMTTLTGHTHRGGVHYATTRSGIVAAYECFCLCDPTQAEYVSGLPNWQQGLVLATVTDEIVHIMPIIFHSRRGRKIARWRGKEYRV